MFNHTIDDIIIQGIAGIPLMMVELVFWILTGIVKAAARLETLLPTWQIKAEEAAGHFSIMIVKAVFCIAGSIVDAWEFRNDLISEMKEAMA